MTCQRIEGSESSSQQITDFRNSGPSDCGVFVAISLLLVKETVSVAKIEIHGTDCIESIHGTLRPCAASQSAYQSSRSNAIASACAADCKRSSLVVPMTGNG
jgi:hypothetical protein